MGVGNTAVNPPFGSLIAGPPNGLEHRVAWLAAGLGSTEHPR
jgi:hypothetical protein